MKKYIFLFVLLFGTTRFAYGQFLQSSEDPDYYKNRINDLKEFVDRFSRRQIPDMFDSADVNLPYLQVASCFCIDSVKERRDEVEDFVKKMVDSNVTLDLYEMNYFCELECEASYKGQDVPIVLQLVMEQLDDGGYCWSIVNARGDVLRMIPNRMSRLMHISPVDDDMQFIELSEVLDTTSVDIRNYAYSHWEIDEMSSFIALIAADQLKFKYIKSMSYVFSVMGYEFRVRKINRETNNNGWLITNFRKYAEF